MALFECITERGGGMSFEPELGQMAFGQPWKSNELPYSWEYALQLLGLMIDDCHGANPGSNSGAEFECPAFSMYAYDWGDDDQPYNFKWREAEASWYKWLGRGSSCNDALLDASLEEMLMECIPSIKEGKLE